MDATRIVPRIGQRRHDHTDDHRDRKVLVDGDDSDQQDHEGIGQWHFAQDPKGVPREGADHDHEHHPDQCCQRDLFDQWRADQNEQQQEHRRSDPRNPCAPA